MPEIVRLFSPYPMSHYVVNTRMKKPSFFHTVSIGLGDEDIIQSAVLWNWLVLTSRLPFLWEQKSKRNQALLPARFSHQEEGERDLIRSIGEIQISEMMMTMTPPDVYEQASSNPLSHLETCTFHKSESNLRFIIRAREIAWRQGQGERMTREDLAILNMAQKSI